VSALWNYAAKTIDTVLDAVDDAALWLPPALRDRLQPSYHTLTAGDVFVARFPVCTDEPAEAARVFAFQADRLAPAPIDTLSWAVARIDQSYWAAAMTASDALQAIITDGQGKSAPTGGFLYIAPTGERFVFRTQADRHQRRVRFAARAAALALLAAGMMALATVMSARAQEVYSDARGFHQARLADLRQLSEAVARRERLADLGEFDVADTIVLIDAVSTSVSSAMQVEAFQLDGRQLQLTWQASPAVRTPTGEMTALLDAIAVPGSVSIERAALSEGLDQVMLSASLLGAGQ
tara:strand:- start:88386 stop:89267 length:882 start_codon:yes stop_codon:yes gene_type:complete